MREFENQLGHVIANQQSSGVDIGCFFTSLVSQEDSMETEWGNTLCVIYAYLENLCPFFQFIKNKKKKVYCPLLGFLHPTVFKQDSVKGFIDGHPGVRGDIDKDSDVRGTLTLRPTEGRSVSEP